MKITGITYAAGRRSPVRRLKPLLSVLIFLLICLIILSAYNAWAILAPDKIQSDWPDTSSKLTYKPVNFKSLDDNLRLDGILFEAETPDKTLIMAHDYGKNIYQFSSASFSLIREFTDKGYSVFIYNPRACGNSEGYMATLGVQEKRDLLGAVKAMHDKGAKNIYVLGFGTGAASAILAAEGNKKEAGCIDAIIADSPYINLDSYLDGMLPEKIVLPYYPVKNLTALFIKAAVGGFEAASPLVTVNSLSKPILFIQGSADTNSGAKSLYESYSSKNTYYAHFWEAPGNSSDDNYTVAPARYVNSVLSFLDSINKPH